MLIFFSTNLVKLKLLGVRTKQNALHFRMEGVLLRHTPATVAYYLLLPAAVQHDNMSMAKTKGSTTYS